MIWILCIRFIVRQPTDKVWDKSNFINTNAYFKTIENIKIYLRNNKLQKIIKMIDEIKSSN